MALVPNFSGSESLAYPQLITLTDTSTGTDLTITNRRVYIRTAQNTWLTTSGESTTIAYENWSYSSSSTTLNVLTQSTAPEITVEWYAGNTLTYTKTITFDFDLYDYVFMLGILADQTSAPQVLGDSNYYQNFIQFIVNLTNSENAILYGDDIYSAQNALNQNLLMIQNENSYF